MSHLLDVDFLIACGWKSHFAHSRANRWLRNARSFATCSISEMGFLRVSLSPAYRASFDEALTALVAIVSLPTHRFLTDATRAQSLPSIASGKDITDAQLVSLARHHRLKLATFDAALCEMDWARGIAEDPTR